MTYRWGIRIWTRQHAGLRGLTLGASVVLAVLAGVSIAGAASFPEDPRAISKPVSYDEMVVLLQELDGSGVVTVEQVGSSVEGRSLFLVHLNRGGEKARWRVLFYAQQHGDETSGKDALLFVAQQIARKPRLLPREVDLWLMPLVNPDGGEANRRRNANGADLNRDHQRLSQPETQALYRVVQRVMPHVAVDCHEFTRDSSEYTERGWVEWPIIMMDALNNPLYDSAVVGAARRWVEAARPVMAFAGFNYTRYFVGGLPPDEEQRYSTPDAYDGRNGVGAYGGLSFIIEAGVMRAAEDPNADLGERVAAYLELLWRFIREDRSREADLRAIEASRRAPLPAFIPTNYFWANAMPRVSHVNVLLADTSQLLAVPTANFMKDLVIKGSVSTPRGYVIDAAAAASFLPLLESHGLRFEVLEEPRTVTAERCLLERVEEEVDELYSRYEGRQIVTREAPAEREFAAGSIVVDLDQDARVRAALLLEPAQLFGLFRHEEFRALVGEDKIIPVWRLAR